jgi:hypothetical protein
MTQMLQSMFLHARKVLTGLQKVALRALENDPELEGMAQFRLSPNQATDMAQTEGIVEDVSGKGSDGKCKIKKVGFGRFVEKLEVGTSANDAGMSYAKLRTVQKSVEGYVQETSVQSAGRKKM